MIRSSSEHAIFSCNYKTYKPILSVETNDIIMKHRI